MFYIDKIDNFDLILFGSAAKKFFPCQKHKITENNVNSADTTFNTYSNDNKITVRIYRKEEMIKVLIHEVIHVTKCERVITETFKNIFNVSVDLLTGESITEALATFINCGLCALMNSSDYGKYQELLQKELDFGILQTAKILDHFGFTSMNDFLTNKTKKIDQGTAVFEYHILKTILLYRFDEFIRILKDNNNNKFKAIVLETIQDIKFQEQINKHIKNIKNIDLIPKSVMCTFRMTINQIKI